MPQFTRRSFLRTASLATLGLTVGRSASRAAEESRYKNLVPADRKLRLACIGINGRGYADLSACAGEDIVGVCDVDFAWGQRGFHEFPLAARYRDYRQMLTEMADQIDGVVVATPDHTHYPAALMALGLGKHVYCEKPLTHTIAEARSLKAAAAKAGVVTQMGNQGHANEGTRQVKEWIEAGVIGAVREVHAWTNRPVWPQGIPLPKPAPTVPDTMDWNLWLGVAPEREYSPELAPFNWRGWWDYGCGALGDMACHLLDAPFWALNLRGPVRVTARSEGGSAVSCPSSSVITYEFPARGSLPPLKLTWYDGGKKPPAKLAELPPGEALPKGGVIYCGDQGTMFSPTDYSEHPRLTPESRMKEFVKRPPQTIPRVPGGSPHLEWIAACKGGPAPGSNFVDHSVALTELVLLGNVAIRLGRPIDWDPVQGVCVNEPEADRFLSKNYRLF